MSKIQMRGMPVYIIFAPLLKPLPQKYRLLVQVNQDHYGAL